MSTLTVVAPDGNKLISYARGQPLRDVLETADIRCRSGCRGTGACGLCLLRIESGAAEEPTPNERLHLDEAKLAQGIRLACQVILQDDLAVTILARGRESEWRRPESRNGEPAGLVASNPAKAISRDVHSFGVAVDLGTTHLRLSVVDLDSGQWVCGRHGLNPQSFFGADVLTRLMAAGESKDLQARLRRIVLDALGGALWDIALRDGVVLNRVSRLCIVGNTAMLALLGSPNYDLLLQPQYWTTAIDCTPDNMEHWALSLGVPSKVGIELIQPLAGFVGSDLLTGVLESKLIDGREGALFVDFGTNSEIALWDGQSLWVTSAAGGPAFEGSGTSCGLPGEPGAVHRVSRKDGTFLVDVIGGHEPRGICGSGLVDLIAELLRSGLLTAKGRFSPAVEGGRFVLVPGKANIGLTLADVDLFQRAKAALGAGIQILAAKAGMSRKDLGRICICGIFGRHLNIVNAQEVGLLPHIEPDRVELFTEAALAGCEKLLISPAAIEQTARIREVSNLINLSRCADFEEAYLNHLFLRSFEVG